MRSLALAQIEFDTETQMRESIDGDTVAEYRDAMADGAKFPPLVVFFDGSQYWLADGYHRWHAASEAGLEQLPCDVRKGSRRDAILFACGANSTNGRRRTNADKHRAVVTLLKDEEWSKWSNRVIAERCGVSDPFVLKIRDQLLTVSSCPSRRGADGKTRKATPRKKIASTSVASDESEDSQDDAITDRQLVCDDARREQPTRYEPSYFARFKALWDEADAIGRSAIVTFVNDYVSQQE